MRRQGGKGSGSRKEEEIPGNFFLVVLGSTEAKSATISYVLSTIYLSSTHSFTLPSISLTSHLIVS